MGEPVSQPLHRGAAGQPPLINVVVAPDCLLGAEGQRGDEFQLQGVADDHRALGPPQRAGRALRAPGLTLYTLRSRLTLAIGGLNSGSSSCGTRIRSAGVEPLEAFRRFAQLRAHRRTVTDPL